MTFEAFFLPAENGQRFCLFHPANKTQNAAARGQVVYVHPLTEEMNKSRRMAALQARALALAGYDVLQIDLLGCGDSSGDFGDATWVAWVDDVVSACRWLRERTDEHTKPLPRPPLWLWGLRAGCLLATQAAQNLQEPCHFLFWAPTPTGKPLLQQFLRLKATADLANGNAKSVMDGLRSDLAQGRAVEIGGYLLSPDLANGLEQAKLISPLKSCKPSRVEWFELSTRDDASLTPVAVNAIAQWRQAGYEVHSHIVLGPSFWQTTEIEDAPKLIAATIAAVISGGQ
ncbi:exosortase A system-associated hydrolase 2 [Polaromonas sp. OV174]|uniref:hydrolase 2, exosortase A system-associated n=1 Tax=Polaromonas sp. OV174 TaxID=1855300 RepID=UPI0008EF71D1|nr:hydrolase 2, exosortase A system-associated [Polaromonas sp. OV174]SFC73085.1 exosortase A system-associated hydrolase 2 [Polaromonas sp. OV174]